MRLPTSNRLVLGLAVALSGAFGSAVGAADPPLHPKPLPILVRGKVTAVGPPNALWTPVDVEVLHIYSGEPKLVGNTFQDAFSHAFGGGYSGGSLPSRSFKVGEVGLWTLTEGKFGDVGKRLSVAARQAPSQTFTKEPTSMKLPFEWADAVEKYAKAAPKDRGEMLPKLLRSPNTQIAHWVVERLGEEDSEESSEFLDKVFADKLVADIPVTVQLSLDGVLCARKRDDWLASPLRKSVLKHWVAGKPDGWYGIWVMSRLNTAAQNGNLLPVEAIELLKIGAENKHWSEEERLEAIRQVGEIAGRKSEDEEAYDWLMELLRSHENLAVRRAASRGLIWIPLYPARLKAVEEHLQTETDKDVKGLLEAAVKKAKAMK